MKATIDVPDGLYRRVKARSALEGRSIRDVTVLLFERWLAEMPNLAEELKSIDRPAAADAWSMRWEAINRRVANAAGDDGSTTREVLLDDRQT